jgi:type I restriction enzyme S subunit
VNLRLSKIGDVVSTIQCWNPTSVAGDATFPYIDLSSVDNEKKYVRSIQSIRFEDAPSRARQLVKSGDILVSTVRPNLNGVAKLDDSHDGATASTGFCVLRAKTAVLSPEYLFQWVKSPAFVSDMVRKATGASYPAVSDRIVSESQLPLPPLEEQRRIAAILDQVDDLRRKRWEALSQLDTLLHIIYKDFFGDPVSNPKGFPTTTVGQLGVEMQYGPRFYNEAYSEDGTRIVRITDLSEDGSLDFESMPRLSVSTSELEKHKSIPGELLFARTGATVGKLALISAEDPICIPGAYFIRLRFPSQIDPEFAWHTMRSASIQGIIASQSRQSAQQNFSGPGLRRLPFFVPHLDLQRAFAVRVAEIDFLKADNRAHLGKLDALFASLQHSAFRGEL